jgi:hypothetical protein
LEEWILQGAIIGIIIGALLGLAGDPLIELIDSLIGGSRTSPSEETISSADEENKLKQDIEKEIREEIEPIIPLKKWQQENQEHEIKRSRKCDDLFQEWNNLCSWFGDKCQSFWDQKVELDRQEHAIHKVMIDIRYNLGGFRNSLHDRAFVRQGATVMGMAGVLLTLPAGEAPLEFVGHAAFESYHWADRQCFTGEPSFEDSELALLDKGEQEIMEIRKRKLDEIAGKRQKLKDEYQRNRNRLSEIERLMKEGKCEEIYRAMGYGGLPTKCPYADTAQWQWVYSK